MRFTINREYFLKALNIASKASIVKSANPVLKNLKISINEKRLSILSSNGELSISTELPYKLEDVEIIRNVDKGEILVDSKIITDIVRKVSGTEISFEVIDETVIQINDGKSSFNLNSMRAEEFPDIDLTISGTSFEMDSEELIKLVDQTAFAASIKEQNLVLTALNLVVDQNILTATATDAARMAKKSLPIDVTGSFNANINARVITEIVHLFENEKRVLLALDSRKALFQFGFTTVTSTLINRPYPQTNGLLRQPCNFKLRVNAAEFVSAMERVSLLSGERENIVKLTLSNEFVEVMTKSNQSGSAREALTQFEYDGERMEISFNSLFVIMAIKALNCEEVILAFGGEMKPFMVKNENDNSITQLVTPVRTY